VACAWRIRHKLLLTLGLTVGITSLLLAGSVNGLLSYSNTFKSIESKLAELQKAMTVKEKVKALPLDPKAADPDKEWNHLRDKIDETHKALEEYESQLQITLSRHRDPEKGAYERRQIEALQQHLGHLAKDIKRIEQHGEDVKLVSNASRKDDRWNDEQLNQTLNLLVLTADDLVDAIYHSMANRSDAARSAYRTSMAIIVSTSIVGLLLTVVFLRFFYRSVIYPIRALEQGVGQVAQGDFEHPIEVHSGDEMEDLATAFNDMTTRLREMYRDLAHQVNERSRQLVRSERLASVGFLAAGVAHEINNPLASIAFCSEALEGRLADILEQAPEDSETITKYLRMIQQEAFRCKAITQRLLEFSRSGERRREQTDLAELIQSVLDVVQHLQNSKGKQVVFEPGRRPRAWINAQEIKSVVLNLVVNALDSMDEDGKLTITLGQRDGLAEMVFRDTGCGMSSEILENIFEPFFTRSRTGKGTGLGLAISHRVITQHGGEIEATSAGPGQGSTFTVRLPMHPAESVKEDTLGHAAAA
jgi:signal transduction histidine kinase